MASDTSITNNINQLCQHFLNRCMNKNKALVIHFKYTDKNLNQLKRLFYRKLFIKLHSPYVFPTFDEVKIESRLDIKDDISKNVFTDLSRIMLQYNRQGKSEEATQLAGCIDLIKEKDNNIVNSVLKVLVILGKVDVDNSKNIEDLKYDKKMNKIDLAMFQFDEKALDIFSHNNDHFNSSCGFDQAMFKVDTNSVFNSSPMSESLVLKEYIGKPKLESSYFLNTQASLFSGLTNSFTTSLDISLTIPELPKNRNDMLVANPGRHFNASIDEGFNEPSTFSSVSSSPEVPPVDDREINQLSIWDVALQLDDKQRIHTWELNKKNEFQSSNPFITERGAKAFDCMFNTSICNIEKMTGKKYLVKLIPEKQIYRDSLNAVVGIPSKTYTFYPLSCSLKPVPNLRYSGVSNDALYGLMSKFAQLGTDFSRLNKFCEHHTERPFTGVSGGLILKAFVDAVREILFSYWSAVFVIEDVNNLSLIELWQLFLRFSRQLRFISDICLCTEAFKRSSKRLPKPKFPLGANLLSYLYTLSIQNSSTENAILVLFLFKAVSKPFIRFVSDWLFHGICNDPYNEFFVHMDQQYLHYRDKHFWTQGFQMKESKNSIPLFLDNLADQIFACGKVINLLKLTNIKHFLFDQSIETPTIGITFSSAKLDAIESQSKQYVSEVDRCELNELKRKEKDKLEQHELFKERLAKERNITHNAIKRIEELENKVKAAIREKKSKDLSELKEQFVNAMKEHKEARVKKIEEDKYWMEEMKKVDEKDDDIKRKAREELISYYEKLSVEADKRERHAQWIIERHELSTKRNDFFAKDVLKLKDMTPLDKIFEGNGDEVDAPERNVSSQAPMDKIDTLKSGQPHGHSAFEGTQTKDLLYPSDTEQTLIIQNTDFIDGSVTKDLLYPSTLRNTETGQLKFSEGSETKSLLYPSDEQLVTIPQIKPTNLEGFETKNILYPTNNDNITTPLLKEKRYNTEGNETKNMLYPNENSNSTSAMEFNTTRGVSRQNDGELTKNIMYPSNSDENVSPMQTHTNRFNDEGQITKDLLYPTEPSQSEIQQRSKVLPSEGDETRNLLYSSNDNVPKNLLSEDGNKAGNVHSDDGNVARNLLYPLDQPEITATTSTSRGYKMEGDVAKDLLYGENTDPILLQQRTNFFNPEGFETKSLLYPDELNINKTSESVKTRQFEQDSVMQNILYTSGEEHITDSKHGVKQFEKTSVMQELLYPGEYEMEKGVHKVSKGFEPITRIKDMMYPKKIANAKQDYAVEALSSSELWMDSIVEPFQDAYAVMDCDPQPYLFGECNQSISQHFNQINADKNADIIKKLPLETIIKRSLTVPILAQISLVNKAIVKYFIDDLSIKVHFDAFRKFLLLEDGEFGHSLCSQLFEKVASGIKPSEFCNTLGLNSVISEAIGLSLYASSIEYSSHLAFSTKWIPEVFQISDVAVLDFLELRYRVPWPCNIIVTENSITKYNKVFSFLLRLKKAGWSLHEVFVNLKKAGHDRRAAGSPQLRQLQLFRHEMQHFVNNLERYLVNQIIHVSWQEFQDDLNTKVHSLDDLHKCHVSYLNKIIFRALLSKNAAPVYKLINDIFGKISKFEARLVTTAWQQDYDTGHVTHPLFENLKAAHNSFKQCAEFLFSVISKLVRRGYQDHLDDLLLQVNFNAYYTSAVVDR